MTTQRCIELFADEDLQGFIRIQCRRRAHDEDLRSRCYAEAWAWISEHAPDDMAIDAIMLYAEQAIFNEYRRELRQRKLVGKLLDLCIQEDGEIADFERFGHRWDAGKTCGGNGNHSGQTAHDHHLKPFGLHPKDAKDLH